MGRILFFLNHCLKETKTKPLPLASVRRIESGGYYSSSSSSSASSLLSPRRLLPLIFTNALHVAVDAGSVDVVRLLLKYGLEPNQGGRLPGHALAPEATPPGPALAPPTQPDNALAPPTQIVSFAWISCKLCIM